MAGGIARARHPPGQQHQRLVHRGDRPDREPACAHRLDDLGTQHQVPHVVGRMITPWPATSPRRAQTSKKPSIFSLIAPTACTVPCWFTEPVIAAVLAQRQVGERREQRADLGQRGAVAIDTAVALLEAQARAQRQRLAAAIPCGDERREDQHALRVRGTAELDLALDVDELALAHAGRGGDAHRVCERRAAERQHREAVRLADRLARRRDAQRVVADRGEQLALHPIDAAPLGLDRVLHVRAADLRGAATERVVVRLAQQVAHGADLHRQALAVACQARGVLDRARRAVAIQRPQAGLARERREQLRGTGQRLGGAIDVLVEVRHDLDERREVRVVFGQQVVQQSRSDERHLDVERDRLGLDRHRADQAQRLPERLDAQLACEQRALERFPGERLAQQALGVDDQVAAVGAMQRPGADHGEVGRQRAELLYVLDVADQVGERRIARRPPARPRPRHAQRSG
ncbi:MAG: hypothetical protein U1F11_10370 [Steroidobacteraceae bacterium]